jgi:hypothetical protein
MAGSRPLNRISKNTGDGLLFCFFSGSANSRSSFRCATNGEIVRCFGRDDVCCLLLEGAGTRRATANQQSGLKTAVFAAISEGLRVGSVTFRAISAGIGREIGGLSTHRQYRETSPWRGVFVSFLRGGAFFGRLVGGGRAMVKGDPFLVASMRRPVRSCRVFWLVHWQVWVVGQLNTGATDVIGNPVFKPLSPPKPYLGDRLNWQPQFTCENSTCS